MQCDYNRRWRTSTSLVFWGVIIQYAFMFIGMALMMYLSYNLIDILLGGILPSVASMNLDYYQDRFVGFFGTAVICVFFSFLGYVLYLIGVCLFKSAQRSINSERRTRNIMVVELVMPVLLILACVIFYKCPEFFLEDLTITMWCLFIIWLGCLMATIVLLIQYKGLAREHTWSEMARSGADNLKFSYSCVIWIQGVFILACAIIIITAYHGLTAISSMSHASYGSYGMNDMFGQVNALASKTTDLIKMIKGEVIFFDVVMTVFVVLCIVYRIMGWSRIRIGGSAGEVDINELHPSDRRAYSVNGQFCHKCGTSLPVDSSFCSKCGAPVVEIAALESGEGVICQEGDNLGIDDTETENVVQPLEDSIEYGRDENPGRRPWILWGSIAAGAIAVVIGLWAIFGRKDRFEPDAKIFAETSTVYKSVEDSIPHTPLAELAYGTPIQLTSDGGYADWKKILFENEGKVLEGYVDKNDILAPDEFDILDAAGFDDSEIRGQIRYRMQRLAVLQAAKSLKGKWKLEKTDEDDDNVVNAKYVLVKRVSPSEQCFAFALDEGEEDGRRIAFVYSTPGVFDSDAGEAPVYLAHEDISLENGRIIDVTYNKPRNKYNFSYLMKMGYCGEEEVESSDGPYEDTGSGSSSTRYLGAINLKGQIAGKYDITMTLYEREDGELAGSYRYANHDSSINLTGSYSDLGDGVQNLSIAEYVNDKKTGSFSGRFDGYSFHGMWVSADGEREMPFNVTRY